MKKLIATFVLMLSACLLLCGSARAQQESITGHWEGAYVRLNAIQTVSLDLKMEDGKLVGSFDVPERSIYGEPVTEIDYKFPQLVLKLNYGKFTMQVFSDTGEMTGENKNWNPTVAIHLKRKPKVPSLAYAHEEVRFKNGAINLAGTLVKPLTPAPYPVLVIVHGSGAQGRRESYYRFWGEFFARHGVAALIYDKRGVGESSGNFEQAGFDDLAGDVVAAVELLHKRKDINPQQIGLFGISQGGWLAPLAAARARQVKFMILNVGPAVTVAEQELHRVEYTMRAEEFSEPEIAEALAYTKLLFQVAYTGQGKTELDALTPKLRDKKWAEHVQLVNSQKDLDDWQRIRYDPAPVLQKMTIPVLSLFGEKDVLVPPLENREKMEKYLKAAGNKDVTIRVIPNAGHDMVSFATLRGGEWKWPENYWVWSRKSPEFYEAIVNWLKERGIIAM